MSGARHLFLSLARSGWGETTLGLRVARQLVDEGDHVAFLADPALATLFEGAPFDLHHVGDERGRGFEERLEQVVRAVRPDTIVLADMLMALTALSRVGAADDALLRLGRPIIGLDSWHFPELGGAIDVAPGEDVAIHPSVPRWPHRLVPVPFCRPSAPGAVQLLPAPAERGGRDEARDKLAIPRDAPVVLICTSGWQQRPYAGGSVERAAVGVPVLLGLYLSRLGRDVHVVHVGPKAWPWASWAGDRYRHVPQLPPDRFREVLGAADLLLATNTSATTSVLALASDLPVLTVVNGHDVDSAYAAWSALGYRPSPELERWMATFLPLHRFRMWPMAWHRALGRILSDNPYAATLHPTEILDERGFHARATALLRDRRVQDAAAAVRQDVLATITALPTAPDRIRAILG